jgi:hypothetical protein
MEFGERQRFLPSDFDKNNLLYGKEGQGRKTKQAAFNVESNAMNAKGHSVIVRP